MRTFRGCAGVMVLLGCMLIATGCGKKLTARFEAAPTSGEAPLTVTFTDSSQAGREDITSWLWNFGDGQTGTGQHPSHVYAAAGYYTVTLTVATANETSVLTRQNIIAVTQGNRKPLTLGDMSGWTAASEAIAEADAATMGQTLSERAYRRDATGNISNHTLVADLLSPEAALTRLGARASDPTFAGVFRFVGGVLVMNRFTGTDGKLYLSLSMAGTAGHIATPKGGFDMYSESNQPRFSVSTFGPVDESLFDAIAAHQPATIGTLDDLPILVFGDGKKYKFSFGDVWDAVEDFTGELLDEGEELLDAALDLAQSVLDAISLLSQLPKTLSKATEAVDHFLALKNNLSEAATALEGFVGTYGTGVFPASLSYEEAMAEIRTTLRGAGNTSGVGDLAGFIINGLAAGQAGEAADPLDLLALLTWGPAGDAVNYLSSTLDNLNVHGAAYLYARGDGSSGMCLARGGTSMRLELANIEAIVAAVESGMASLTGIDLSWVSDVIDALPNVPNDTLRGGVRVDNSVMTLFTDIHDGLVAPDNIPDGAAKIWDMSMAAGLQQLPQCHIQFQPMQNIGLGADITAGFNPLTPMFGQVAAHADLRYKSRQLHVDIDTAPMPDVYGYVVFQADCPLAVGHVKAGVTLQVSAGQDALEALGLTKDEFKTTVEGLLKDASTEILPNLPTVTAAGDLFTLAMNPQDLVPVIALVAQFLAEHLAPAADKIKLKVQVSAGAGIGPDIEVVRATIDVGMAGALSLSLNDALTVFTAALATADTIDWAATFEQIIAYADLYEDPARIDAARDQFTQFARDLLVACAQSGVPAAVMAELADSVEIEYSESLSAGAEANAGEGLSAETGLNGSLGANLQAAVFGSAPLWCMRAESLGLPELCDLLLSMQTNTQPRFFVGGTLYGQFDLNGPLAIYKIGAGLESKFFEAQLTLPNVTIGPQLSVSLAADKAQAALGEGVLFSVAWYAANGVTVNELRWDFDGDSVVDATSAPYASMPAHAYTTTGKKHCTVTAVAQSGRTATAAWDVYVGAAPTGPEMVTVPAGWFRMGLDDITPYDCPWTADMQPLPERDVYLDPYEIGKYEVTNGEWAEMLNWALGKDYLKNPDGTPFTNGSLSVWTHGQTVMDFVRQGGFPTSWVRFADGHFYVEAPDGKNLTNHPVTAASWFGAAAYCNWLSERRGLQQVYDWAHWETQRKSPLPNGYRLPTEAEWERAACWSAALNQYTLPDSSTGGRYPYAFMSTQLPLGDWGNNWCNYNYANPMSLPFEPYTTPVGYYTAAASSAGCFDMNGNAWEWCHDFFDTQTGAQPDTNPIGPGPSQLWGGIKVLRGMSYTSGGCPMSAFVRTGFSQGGDHTIGFRLARLGGDPR